MSKLITAFVLLFSFQISQATDVSLVRDVCNELRSKSQAELDGIYSAAEAGKIPQGPTTGCVIGWPKHLANYPLSAFFNVIWRGKVFDPETNTLKNSVLGTRIVAADVYYGTSLLDGKNSIIVDYKKAMLPFKLIRDEIREVEPGIYLGRAHVKLPGNKDVLGINFALFQ